VNPAPREDTPSRDPHSAAGREPVLNTVPLTRKVSATYCSRMPAVSANSTADRPASAFPLNRVRLLDGDFKAAQDASLRYILELDADRLCAPYLQEAGLASPAEPYGNWESDGMGGHIGGHYVSTCAQLFAATGDGRLRERRTRRTFPGT